LTSNCWITSSLACRRACCLYGYNTQCRVTVNSCAKITSRNCDSGMCTIVRGSCHNHACIISAGITLKNVLELLL
jgi:hypothetical protein